VILTSAFLFSAEGELVAQDEIVSDSSRSRVSIGLRVGYAWPIGDWTTHRFAPIDQFSSGLTFGGDLEIRTGPAGGIAIIVEHTPLDVTAWEDYAASNGAVVEASASVTFLGLALRTIPADVYPTSFKLDVGAMVALQSGKESTGLYTYEYDFMKNPGFGLFTALEFMYLLSPKVGLTVRGSIGFVFSGIQYADGVEYIVMLAPVTGGLRFYL
jgi:hypothetical protein